MIRRSFSSKPLLGDIDYYEDTAPLFVARVQNDAGLSAQYQISTDDVGSASVDANIVTTTGSNTESRFADVRYDVKVPLTEVVYTDNGGTDKLMRDSIASIPNAGLSSDTLNEGASEDAPTDRVGKDSLVDCGLIIDDRFFYNFITAEEQEVDADGNVTGYTHISTYADSSGNFYISKNHYDAEWTLTYSSFSDSAGNSSATQYKTSVDADGNVTGYTHSTTSTYGSGIFYFSENHYNATGGLTDSAYSDSAGNSSATQYKTSVDADGNVTGYTHITTSIDASGNSYTYTNNYDAQWTVIDTAYSDSTGNSSVTQYQTSIDADGNVMGYTHTTTSTDANGNFYGSENHYNATWTLTHSAYSDSAGNGSATQYKTSVDAEGNVTGYTHITNSTDASGNSYTYTNNYDAQWTVTASAYSDSAGNSSVTQYQTNIDADGNVIGYTHTITSTDASGNFYTSENHYDTNWVLTDSIYSDNAVNSIVKDDSIANILDVGYGADSLNGSAGEDTLMARTENDALIDVVGKDVFPLNPVICNKIGVIVNLRAEIGEIKLSESAFTPLDSSVTLSNDMVFYTANSAVGLDADNSGSLSGAVEIALLSAPYTHTNIALTDFSVI